MQIRFLSDALVTVASLNLKVDVLTKKTRTSRLIVPVETSSQYYLRFEYANKDFSIYCFLVGEL